MFAALIERAINREKMYFMLLLFNDNTIR
jgi:hypothetical protein